VTVSVGPAEARDAAGIADLMAELDSHYGATDVAPLDERTAQISRALFGLQPAAYALLARDEARIVGIAAYSYLWPAAGTTSSLYLKELYVRRDVRRCGIGRSLMRAVFAIAEERDCSRVEWATEVDNHDAQDFYGSLGAPVQNGKVAYRVDDDDIAAIHKRLSTT
jgi:GNAT superfamily N-acetyltransferase